MTASSNSSSSSFRHESHNRTLSERLHFRADIYRRIRQYFLQQQVLEVDVPVLGVSGSTDVHLASMTVKTGLGGPFAEQYLQTSPECYMKRLLCDGSGDIYSLGKAFRAGEQGVRHRSEFTMLEWYRCDFTLEQLMADVEQLLLSLGVAERFERMRYRDVFIRFLGICPHQASEQQLQQILKNHMSQQTLPMMPSDEVAAATKADLLDILMSFIIEPQLPKTPVFIIDYPKEQAALAQLSRQVEGDTCFQVARRFELYIGGIELANGYWELTDAVEQSRRIQADNEQRKTRGLPEVVHDQILVDMLQKQGLPACSGVALGVDRLLMILQGALDIADIETVVQGRG